MKRICIIFLLSCLGYTPGICQATIFSLFQDPAKTADAQFAAGNYTQAATLYTAQLAKEPGNAALPLKLAQARYRAKDYGAAVAAYDRYTATGQNLLWPDLYAYAEANATLGRRSVALDYYKRCLAQQPDHDIVAKKIWRLSNIQYLYEDSALYFVRPVAVNTVASELCAVPYNDGFVFASNRKGARIVEKTNRKLNTPFYTLYQAAWKEDTTTHTLNIGKPVRFASTLKARYNTGPVAFYNEGKAMVLVTTAAQPRADGLRTLGLSFARLEGTKWKMVSAFAHNSNGYSIHDISISPDGKTLYFSCDMAGGLGGKDIYISRFVNEQWTKPENLGEPINTPMDEVFPFLHDKTLYFSSDGQPGMGQLDIFKAQILTDGYGEPENLGYPANSSYDDFGIALDSAGNHGYLTSNRKHGRYDDDLYELDMNLQTYPFTVAAVLKYKANTWSDQAAIVAWPRTKVELVDSETDDAVFKTTTDAAGSFSIEVPRHGLYHVRITDEEGSAYKASFELSKYRKESGIHEVVIIRDAFKKKTDRK